jgi:uracil phosphoribosyltransferase
MALEALQSNLAACLLTALRDRSTPAEEFRRLSRAITHVLIAEATRDLSVTHVEVQTPLEPARGAELQRGVVLAPVLRAGLGMLDAALEMLPRASVGFVGLERDEATAVASCYYCKLPEVEGRTALMLDPMLATGGSAAWAAQRLYESGAAEVRLLCIVAAPEGVERLAESFPQLRIFAAALDRALDERKYILPGLGDFGDRLFGTA